MALFQLEKQLKKKALQRCNQIICSGKDETITLQTTVFKIPKNNIKFLMNPIDLSMFQKREKIEICKKLNYDSKFEYLLYIGRLVRNKGIENTLKAFNEISKKQNNVKLIIIGNGPLDIEIKKFIEKNHLEESIFLKGHLSHDEICYYYNIASVLINVGPSGGLPNVIIESIASKLPVIATDAGATKDFVNEKTGTGILIKGYDSATIKSAILRILEDKNFEGKFDQKILEQFSFDNFGKELIKIYEKANKRFLEL